MTHEEMKSNLAKWLMRDDLTDSIPLFISFAEAEINRRVRTRHMVARARVTATDRYLPLPNDWRKAWNIQRVEDDYPLEYKAPAELDRIRYENSLSPEKVRGGPIYYTLFGDDMEFFPSPTLDDPCYVEMIYYTMIPNLQGDADTNWLLNTHPDLYFYGALKHTSTFLMDDARLPVWEKLFETALASVNTEDDNSRRSGAPMTRSIHGF